MPSAKKHFLRKKGIEENEDGKEGSYWHRRGCQCSPARPVPKMGMMGPGYGPGTMYGPGYGYRGYGPSMHGYGPMDGYGPAVMHGYMGGYGYGPVGPGGYGADRNLNLPADDVKAYLERWIAVQGNPRLKVGDVKEKDADTFEADIVTKLENALVQRVTVNRRTGAYRPSGS